MRSLRVLFITQDDPLYVRVQFEGLFNHRAPEVEIAGVVVAPPMGKKGLRSLARQMYDFYGPVDFLRIGLRFAFCKLMGRMPKFLRGNSVYTIEQACTKAAVPVERVLRLNDPTFVQSVRSRKIDLVVSIAAPQIFKSDLINAPTHGCINIHNAPLPKYRGMLPNFWQMLHGEPDLGVTVHRVNEALDEGAILAQARVPRSPNESLDDVIRRTKREGAVFLMQTLVAMARGEISERPNNVAEGSYYSFPTRADVREFRNRGLRLV
jgi:methionyl-tRNA formyltransferase